MAIDETVQFKLPPDTRARLEGMAARGKEAKRMLGILKKLGLDVTDMEEKLTWAEDIRKVMLTEFSE